MLRKDKLATAIVKCDTVKTGSAVYKYTLYASESQNVVSYRMPLYSISIEMTDENGKATKSKIENVFCDIGKAIVFYEHLKENLATPLNLPYILEDKISI